jgi:hypothetical protein
VPRERAASQQIDDHGSGTLVSIAPPDEDDPTGLGESQPLGRADVILGADHETEARPDLQQGGRMAGVARRHVVGAEGQVVSNGPAVGALPGIEQLAG